MDCIFIEINQLKNDSNEELENYIISCIKKLNIRCEITITKFLVNNIKKVSFFIGTEAPTIKQLEFGSYTKIIGPNRFFKNYTLKIAKTLRDIADNKVIVEYYKKIP